MRLQLRSSNHTGYYIVIVNSTGDTLRISNDVCEGNKLGGGTRFPWLLPMNISMKKADLVSYQPCLWQTLRKLMPDTMRLFNQLNNNTLQPNSTLQNGDLIFYTRQNYVPMEKAHLIHFTPLYSYIIFLQFFSLFNFS